MNPPRHPRPGTQRGAAALIVVMLLFFIVSLVAAYAGRNLIFEQKTSANQYRATQAFEAAEAGLEWALAMLNGGRIDASCTGSGNVADSSFRTRYLVEAAGKYTPSTWDNDGAPERFRPSCVRSDDPANPWTCSCPTAGAPVLAAPGGDGVFPAFRVCFERVPLDPLVPSQPGAVRVVSTGRTSFVDQPCEERGEGTAGDAAASVSVVVALSSALQAPPVAALTAGRNVIQGGGNLTVVNVDPLSNGLTMHVGAGAATLGGNLIRRTLAGTPEPNSTALDPTLGNLTADRLFTSRFQMAMSTYKTQPATVVVDCSSDCANRLQQAVQGNPGRIVWVEGNVQASANLDLGSDNEPAMIVVDGDVQVQGGNVNVVGFLSSQRDVLINGGNLNVRGAVAVTRDVRIDGGNTTIEYNPAHPTQPTLIPPVLTHLQLASGSLVRVPGSWRDFP